MKSWRRRSPNPPGLRVALLEENYCRAQDTFTEFVLFYA